MSSVGPATSPVARLPGDAGEGASDDVRDALPLGEAAASVGAADPPAASGESPGASDSAADRTDSNMASMSGALPG
jgi:hypothetical protein